jgi:hypothetical protein
VENAGSINNVGSVLPDYAESHPRKQICTVVALFSYTSQCVDGNKGSLFDCFADKTMFSISGKHTNGSPILALGSAIKTQVKVR